MKTQTIIGLLSTTAVLLIIANLFLPSRASAVISVEKRDYQAVTAPFESGGDALYILDNRSGQIAVFTYDPSAKGIVPQGVRSVSDGFVTR